MTTEQLTITSFRTFVGSKDFDLSRDFYVALGWQQRYDSTDLRLLERAGHSFYLQNYYTREWCENSMLHIGVDELRPWFDSVNAILEASKFPGVRSSSHIKDEGYAEVFHVWDPAGVLLHFAQFK